MIWIIIIDAVFWVLYYVGTQNVKSDIDLWGKDVE